MGSVIRLGDVIGGLFEFDSQDTIYASEPWTDQSKAIVVREPDAGGLPPEASSAGMKYFLEVNVAREFIEDWLASLDEKPTSLAVCRRVVDYAINDA